MDFAVFLLNRSIQDLSDHDASKELKNPLRLQVDSSVSLTHRDPRDLGLICLVKKSKIFVFGFLRIYEFNIGFS